MEIKEINLDKVRIISAYEVQRQKLLDYYYELYPARRGVLSMNWEWQNRTEYLDRKIPLVLEHEGEILGHLGSMPFEVNIEGKKYTAQWLIDFSISQPYRRLGLGNIITQKWMELCDINLTCCNSKAIKIFKKYGWTQNEDSYLHFLFINPFMYPKIAGKIGKPLARFFGFLSKPAIRLLYKRRSFPENLFQVEKLTPENIKCFENSQMQGDNVIATSRNESFLKWRFMDSFDKEYYRVFSIMNKNVKCIIKLHNDGYKYIEVLTHIEPMANDDLLKLLASLCIWAGKENYNHVLFYSSRKDRNLMLKFKLRSYSVYQIFAYHSHNKELYDFLDKSEHYWDLCDSDFERYKFKLSV
jgi:hypothetical protein